MTEDGMHEKKGEGSKSSQQPSLNSPTKGRGARQIKKSEGVQRGEGGDGEVTRSFMSLG